MEVSTPPSRTGSSESGQDLLLAGYRSSGQLDGNFGLGGSGIVVETWTHADHWAAADRVLTKT